RVSPMSTPDRSGRWWSSLAVASDAAIVGLSAAAGQTFIPIPLLGAVLGSIAGKVVALALGGVVGAPEPELMRQIEACETETLASLPDNDQLRSALDELDAYFGKLTCLSRITSDEAADADRRLEASIQMAQIVAVSDRPIPILRSTAETDAFIHK
ncbi:MAG: hypothetical protein OXJ90_27065, partial [Spirochaetaceae bacterium]|nr:hypothetical protein [Spirochaetaceae bacterium]